MSSCGRIYHTASMWSKICLCCGRMHKSVPPEIFQPCWRLVDLNGPNRSVYNAKPSSRIGYRHKMIQTQDDTDTRGYRHKMIQTQDDTDTRWHTHKMIHTQDDTDTRWYRHKMIQTQEDTDTRWYRHKMIQTQDDTDTRWYTHKMIHTQDDTDTRWYRHKRIHTQDDTDTRGYIHKMRISGFRRGVYKIVTLLRRYAAVIGSYQQPIGLFGPTGCPETSVTKYQSTANIPEECRSQIQGGPKVS